ncbi:transposase [Tenacibaculum tangerinum]|uniref:Transposase n=1 Tax=Tenacibaculum tangerinum TaxID=3038772 RepID=A0ABY8L422_9FLAO|nr:transposase [Tenacibaculum tangerinum]WGH76177.1 transposase [Tenacibaculum tangerinum]
MSNIARINSRQGRYMKAKRQSTVAPVFGTLTQYMGLRKVNVRGINGANKCMLMAGAAYNIKKLLKFFGTPTKTEAKAVAFVFWLKRTISLNKFRFKLRKKQKRELKFWLRSK